MSALTVIEAACQTARARGVELVRGATFDWGREPGLELPLSCNALGAVLLVHGAERAPRSWHVLSEILGEGYFYFYRWTIGWDNLHVLSIYKVGKDGELIEVGKDKVSADARALSKRLLGVRR